MGLARAAAGVSASGAAAVVVVVVVAGEEAGVGLAHGSLEEISTLR